MLVFLLHLCLCSCLLPVCCAEGFCPVGWFGYSCMYMCHCSNTQQCDMEGRCPDKCASGYFGPGCQYVDMCYTKCSPQVPEHLRDGDDDTCNVDKDNKSVVLSMLEPYFFYWFRIVLQNSDNIRSFTMIFNNSTTCVSERKMVVSPTTVDVLCDNKQELRTLEIRGAKVPHLCSIYISGGRNVAINQHARISSAYPVAAGGGIPSKVIDGDTRNTHGACVRSDVQTSPWWKVTYNRPQVLTRIVIYTLNDEAARLAHFVIETRYLNNVTSRIPCNNTIPKHIYDINIHTEELTTSVSITQQTGNVIRLCEVQTFGETMCRDQLFGLYCQHNCSCPLYQSCSMVTGACFSQCREGLYGFKCTLRCNNKCYNNSCQARSGECSSCLQGGRATSCNPVCEPGAYGPNCQRKCSTYCASDCDNVTGSCTCKQNHTGPDCTDCPTGTFGEFCTDKCPATCKDNRCDSESGFCSECPTGYFGKLCDKQCSKICKDDDCYRSTGLCKSCRLGEPPTCQACPKGFYGPRCDLGCPRTCRDRDCDVYSGICLTCSTGRLPHCGECPTGFYGKDCAQACPAVCNDSTCSSHNGSCFACRDGRLPPYCEVCPPGRYGQQCERSCPKRCKNDLCQMETGACYVCEMGLKPPDCIDAGGSSMFYWVLAGLVVLFVMIMVLVAAYLWRRKSPSPVEMTEEWF